DFTEAEAAPLAEGLKASVERLALSVESGESVERQALRGEGETPDLNAQRSAPDARSPQRLTLNAQRLLRRVLYWTGGHPYLTQRLCAAVSSRPTHPHTHTPT